MREGGGGGFYERGEGKGHGGEKEGEGGYESEGRGEDFMRGKEQEGFTRGKEGGRVL